MPETFIQDEVRKAAGESFSPEQNSSKEERGETIDFSKSQMDKIIASLDNGQPVEYESFSPYLRDNDMTNASLKDELTAEDQTGMEVLKLLNRELPEAKSVSLYDEYNLPDDRTESFSANEKDSFLQSIKDRLDKEGAEINEFISESSKQETAQQLTDRLQQQGLIKEKKGALYFNDGQSHGGQNDEHFFPLKTQGGRWTCEALDASSFLDEKNQKITHLVILPKSFQLQQDRVWNILHALGIKPENYHNIFFDTNEKPETVVQKIQEEITKARK